MNKSCLKPVVFLILTVIFVVVMSYHTLPRNLGQTYPELVNGAFTGYLKHGEQVYLLPEELENSTIAELLQDTHVKSAVNSNLEPETAFCLRFSGSENLSIVVGQNGSIILAETDNLEASRRFWKDDGSLFEAIYAYHLQLGGEAIPEV